MNETNAKSVRESSVGATATLTTNERRHQNYIKNREKLLADSRLYYQNNKEKRKAYYENNKDARLNYGKERYKKLKQQSEFLDIK